MSADERLDADECRGNAAPFVLGVLPEPEHETFRRHMESCAVCREEVAALQVVASALPATAPQLKAPSELKQRVMADVLADAREHESPRLNGGERAGARRSPPRRRLAFAAAGATAALAAALLAVLLVAGGGGGTTRTIPAQSSLPRASASLRVSGGRAELLVSGMPQTAADRVYEVWVKRSGAPQPTDALFRVTSAGNATVGVPGGVSGVKVVMVTSEPLGGSRVPTSPPVIVAPLS